MYRKDLMKFLWFSCLFVFLFNYYSPYVAEENGVYTSVSNSVLNTSSISNSVLNTSSDYLTQLILGGEAVGFEYQGDGILVLSNNRVATMEGYIENITKEQLTVGDIIHKINGIEVNSAEDISNILNNEENLGTEVTLTITRKNKELETKVTPVYDLFAKKYKLGVWVKDYINGIGTITYIRPDNGQYGALGHPITESTTGEVLGVKTGKVYNCSIVGIARGSRGVPGELRGAILKREVLGSVESNNDYGVYGKIEDEKMIDSGTLIDVGGRATVKPGKAQIYSSIDNGGVQAYDIEIIKTNYQSISNEKSLVFKVTDKELLAKTGGILQGMSGSPIVQNNKLVGAVTHVFINDATKGFGIYIDWMLK